MTDELADEAARAAQQEEQFEAGSKATAHQCAMLHRAFLAEGFNDENAALLTAHWLTGSMYVNASDRGLTSMQTMLQSIINPESDGE